MNARLDWKLGGKQQSFHDQFNLQSTHSHQPPTKSLNTIENETFEQGTAHKTKQRIGHSEDIRINVNNPISGRSNQVEQETTQWSIRLSNQEILHKHTHILKENEVQKKEEENKPATIRRPGAETKVGGSPLTTMGFKASPLA